MLVATKFRVPESEADGFAAGAARAVAALARRPGYRYARLGRAADDPLLWLLVAEWDGAGFYRRALSDFDVRVELTPLTAFALDEPGAYEIVLSDGAPAGPGESVTVSAVDRAPDADTAGPGRR